MNRIMRHIHKMNLKRHAWIFLESLNISWLMVVSCDLACKVLDEFLSTRLYNAERQEWVEKAFITRLWMSLGNLDASRGIEEIQAVVESLTTNLQKPLDATATHAAQMVKPLHDIPLDQ